MQFTCTANKLNFPRQVRNFSFPSVCNSSTADINTHTHTYVHSTCAPDISSRGSVTKETVSISLYFTVNRTIYFDARKALTYNFTHTHFGTTSHITSRVPCVCVKILSAEHRHIISLPCGLLSVVCVVLYAIFVQLVDIAFQLSGVYDVYYAAVLRLTMRVFAFAPCGDRAPRACTKYG